MNPLTRIISLLINGLNHFLESMDRKTVEAIKQSFYFITFVALIIAIIIGYNSGKKAAKRGGKTLAENTNQVFSVDVKRERPEGRFYSMLDTDAIREIDRSDYNKLQFPSRATLEPENRDELVEPDLFKKEKSPEIDIDRLAEIDRTDEKPEPSIKTLPKRESPLRDRKLDIIDEKKENRIITGEDAESEKPKEPEKMRREMNEPRKMKDLRKGTELNPLEKREGIIE
jgi:hypothetical protein